MSRAPGCGPRSTGGPRPSGPLEELRSGRGGGPGRARRRARPGTQAGRGRAAPGGRRRRRGRGGRQAAREARQADEVRLGLLLDTVGGALSGLRRELALGGGGPRPGGPRGGRPVGARRRCASTRCRRSTRCCRCRRCTSSSTATTSPRPATPSCRWPTSARGSRASSPRSPRGPASRSPSSSTARAWWRRADARLPRGAGAVQRPRGARRRRHPRAGGGRAAGPSRRGRDLGQGGGRVGVRAGRAQRALARCSCSGSRAADRPSAPGAPTELSVPASSVPARPSSNEAEVAVDGDRLRPVRGPGARVRRLCGRGAAGDARCARRQSADGAATDGGPGRPSGAPALHLDAPEQRALAVLADQGLVPRLRLVSGPLRRVTQNDHDGENGP